MRKTRLTTKRHDKRITKTHRTRSTLKALHTKVDKGGVQIYTTSRSPYQPLNQERKEIRLLVVKAGSGTQQLRCELRNASLAKQRKPRYETISYCWGDPKPSVQLWLNGKRHWVPVAAEAVIRRMRLPDADRTLWIDAVCINQEDINERSHQVAMMYEIYTYTYRNLVWLGEDDGTTAEALKIVENVLRDARDKTDDFRTLQTTLRGNDKQLKFSHKSTLNFGSDPHYLVNFYSHRWFERLWVVQEVALPPTTSCYCGAFEFTLEDVMRTAAWLYHHQFTLPDSLQFLSGLINAAILFDLVDREHGFFRKSQFYFVTILDCMSAFKTTDQRDLVYGLLGLQQSRGREGNLPQLLRPDYEKPLRDVLRDATRYAIQERGNLDIFDNVGERGRFDTSMETHLPSWVPLWHVDWDRMEDHGLLLPSFYADDDVAMHHIIYDTLEDSNRLSLAGISIDTVSGVTAVTTKQTLECFDGVTHHLEELQTLLRGVSGPLDGSIIGETLISARNADRGRATGKECQDYTIWSAYLAQHGTLPPVMRQILSSEQDHDEETRVAAKYDHAMFNACVNRRFFVTKSGSIGLGPRQMGPGDIVAVLYGCRWPVVLRQHGEYFELIGVSYVRGIMEGEAVRKHRAEGKEDRIFVI